MWARVRNTKLRESFCTETRSRSNSPRGAKSAWVPASSGMCARTPITATLTWPLTAVAPATGVSDSRTGRGGSG